MFSCGKVYHTFSEFNTSPSVHGAGGGVRAHGTRFLKSRCLHCITPAKEKRPSFPGRYPCEIGFAQTHPCLQDSEYELSDKNLTKLSSHRFATVSTQSFHSEGDPVDVMSAFDLFSGSQKNGIRQSRILAADIRVGKLPAALL